MQETFRLTQKPSQGLKPDEESSRPLLASGCCIDFHPVLQRLALLFKSFNIPIHSIHM